jgi:hypothetical protein
MQQRRQQLATYSRHHARAIAACVGLGGELEIQVQVAGFVRTHHLVVVPERWPQPTVAPPEDLTRRDDELAPPTLRDLDGPHLLAPLARLAQRRLLKCVQPPAVLLGGPPGANGSDMRSRHRALCPG